MHLWRSSFFVLVGLSMLLSGCPDIAVAPCNPENCSVEASCLEPTCDGQQCSSKIKQGFCYIQGVCYGDGDSSSVNKCAVCDPDQKQKDFSDIVCDTDAVCQVSTCDVAQGCVLEGVSGDTCDDGDECAGDQCVNGVCEPNTCGCDNDADCADVPGLGPCEKGVCVEKLCQPGPDASKEGDDCDDNDACTLGDSCASGVCVAGNQTKDCSELDAACVVGVCDAVSGDCQTENAANASDCDDSDACTNGDICKGGECTGTPIQCVGGDGVCTVAECIDGSCQETINQGQVCDAGDSCILNAMCTAGGACNGEWDTENCTREADVDCPIGPVCTTPVCGQGACGLSVFPGSCFIAGVCYVSGQKSPGNACQQCNPSMAQGDWSPVVCAGDDSLTACQSSVCDPAGGCVAENAANGTSCDDGSQCTKDDHCEAGVCLGSCKCTQDSHCQGKVAGLGQCQAALCIDFECVASADASLNGGVCDDGDKCTTGETCQAGECKPGSAVNCTNLDGECTTGVCNPQNGECSVELKAEGAACSDGEACTTGDKCSGGSCFGEPLDCSGFDNACQTFACNGGTCEPSSQSGACDDGDPCTVMDACDANGACEGTYDAGLSGCACVATADCDDGLSCTNDVCNSDGSCANPVKPGGCLIGNSCYALGDAKAGNKCLVCDPAFNNKQFKSLTCDDKNSCTDDVCQPAEGCVALNNDDSACSDGDDCTQDDHCDAGSCTGTCACTQDSDCVNADNGVAAQCKRWACQAFTCVQVADSQQDGSACDDAMFCSEGETCQAGLCGGGTAKNCATAGDGKCVVGQCNETVDKCVGASLPDGNSCNDANPCTSEDSCSGGVCLGEPIDCSDLADACHTAGCVGGECKATPKAGAACNDGEDCTVGDTCSAGGVCQGGWDSNGSGCGCNNDGECSDLTTGCKVGKCNVASHTCFTEALLGEPCNDAKVCTKDDQCNAEGQCSGSPYSCNDTLDCTNDVCDGQGGCTNAVKVGKCLIGDACFNLGEVNTTNPCEQCAGGLKWSSNPGNECDDGEACTGQDTCQAEGNCAGEDFQCEPTPCQAALCTGDGCEHTLLPGWCHIEGLCVPAGTQNANDACQSCLPGQNTGAWSNNNQPCDDDDVCTKDDLCSQGSCSGSPYSCNDTACESFVCDGAGGCPSAGLKGGTCKIGGACRTGGVTNPVNECQLCEPTMSQTGWSAATGASCSDGLACTSSDACTAQGVCQGIGSDCTATLCEDATCEGAGGCTYTLKQGWCKIGKACVGEGEPNGANPCEICNPDVNPNGWSVATNTSCDDGFACTYGDSCKAGSGGAVCSGQDYSCNDNLSCTQDICGGSAPDDCQNILVDGCLIGGQCYAAGESTDVNDCQWCDPAASTFQWVNTPSGSGCTPDSLSCTDDICNGAGSCVHVATAESGQCFISGGCYDVGASSPAAECLYCASAGNGSWSPRPSSTSCSSDGNGCTLDKCDGFGSCGHQPLDDWSTCAVKVNQGICLGGNCQSFVRFDADETLEGLQLADGNGEENRIGKAAALDDNFVHLPYINDGKPITAMYINDQNFEQAQQVAEFSGQVTALSSSVLVTGWGEMWHFVNNWTQDSELVTVWQNMKPVYEVPLWTAANSDDVKTGRIVVAGHDEATKTAMARVCEPVAPVFDCVEAGIEDESAYTIAAVGFDQGGYGYLLAGNYDKGKYMDTLAYDASGTFKLVGRTSTGEGTQWTDLKVVKGVLVGAATGGYLVTGTPDNFGPVAVSKLSTLDFKQVAHFDERLFVVGQYDSSPGDKDGTMAIYVVHAHLNDPLEDPKTWETVKVENQLTQTTPPLAFDDYFVSGIVGTEQGLQMHGNWFDGKNGVRVPAIWYWTP